MVDQTSPEPPQYDWQAPKAQFDVGRVLGRTFSAIKENFLRFSLLSIIIVGLPMFILGLWPLLFSSGGGILSDNEFSETAVIASVVASLLGVLAYLTVYVLVQAILVHACFKQFAGEHVSIKLSASTASKFLFPIIGMSIIYFIVMMFGFLLLIIPGILIMLGWYISIPTLLVEKQGVTKALGRSWELSKGYKRWILLILIILTILSIVISTVLTLFAVPFGDVTTATLTGGSTIFWIVYALSSALGQAFTVMINASAVAAIYYEIRDLKEGITPMSIASVFD